MTMNTAGISHSQTVPMVDVFDPNTGLPSPPRALHHPHCIPGIRASVVAAMMTAASTNGTGHT